MNEYQDLDPENSRILARGVALTTTMAEHELSLANGKPTWSMSFPPDHD
jgi:hypothetical protein